MTPAGKLYVVATPIGNLDDITQRALATLQQVNLIAAEDTRNALRLLNHFSIKQKCIAYHDHNENSQSSKLIELLKDGQNIALISDAGTPLINDPGYHLVKQCRAQNIQVVPIPGACAVITALCAAGVATDQFYFGGFVPPKQQARQALFKKLTEQTYTSVFYESTHRIIASLQDLQTSMGAEQTIVIGRELTKTFETFYAGTVADTLDWIQADHNQQKGEFVLIIEGAEKTQEIDQKSIDLLVKLKAYMPLKAAAGIVAETYGVNKKALYQAGIELD
ncbi:16S rRNA (cytidine(1402)-2'-O)-methyltransferase [Catenovulum sp. 2E275]|uniref:16S rRNA (cytidine(1402)-2'-O)-methyltransferase n=1 Tax=Catenovulum sp. 2E275 TaxID=2980497 RepID=UPI0021D11433|nr:16S rRNA (cytidine(1402)-2'-O)-methyltransferase [Catenovulum sp. 2E275]MCU4676665.1 16S rRNA (cytidine(1402)-2'-O)-methyltransferase [Catenovulum sp. 2E275]